MPDDATAKGDPGGDEQQQQQPTQPPEDLGDAGKRAIEEERRARRAAEKRLSDLEKELTAFRESSMSEQEKAIEAARREARADAQKAFDMRLRQAEVRAAAAGKLADPEDAVRFLDLDTIDVDSEGAVDKKAVTKLLDELVKAKPYLAVSATRPTGDADQGARGASAGGSDMNALMRRATGRA